MIKTSPVASQTAAAAGLRAWSDDQAAVLTAAKSGRDLVVTGPPGSGKSALAVELAVRALGGEYGEHRVLLLTASRRAAGRLRESVMGRTDRTVKGVAVRSVASLAFSISTAQARMQGEPDPVLITGPEQDVELAQLLAGQTRGFGVAIDWPDDVTAETLLLDGFRAELRDVMMRCAERGIFPDELADLGRRHDMPQWAGVAALYDEYLNVIDFSSVSPDRGTRFDSATVVDRAARIARAWALDDTPGREKWDLVIVDDYQDATAATARLLGALHLDGAQLVLLADPDQTVQGFRGSRPDLVAVAEAAPVAGTDGPVGAFNAQPIVLTRQYRFGGALADVVATVSSQIGAVAGVRHRLRPGGGGDAMVDEPSAAGLATDATRVRGTAGRVGNAAGRTEGAVGLEPSSVDAEVGPQADPITDVLRLHFRSQGDELAWMAWRLRARHYLDGEPWSDMAVIARSGSGVRSIVSELQRAGIPARTEGADQALKDDPLVRLLLETVLRGASQDWDESLITELLGSTYGDLDAVAIRALRRVLLGRADDVGRGSLLAAFTERGGLDALGDSYLAGTPIAAAAYRIAAMIRASRPDTAPSDTALPDATLPDTTRAETGRSSGGTSGRASIGDALWRVWDAAAVAERVRDLAMQSGPRALAADQSLDAMMTLFKQAEIYSERNAAATPVQFIGFIRQFDLPADSLAATSQRDIVHVLTPAQAAGRQWPHVVVAGVQVGTWPDLRLRDSLLGAQRLADIVDGRGDGRDQRAARRSVLDDELRLFEVACSRAQASLTVTAVFDDELQPSPLCDLVQPEWPNEVMIAPPPLDLRGIVLRARVRGAAAAPSTGVDSDAGTEVDADTDIVESTEFQAESALTQWAAFLATLARSGVDAADPSTWYGVALPTPARELAEPGTVSVSPSRVALAHQCSLRWAAETLNATPSSGVANHVGNLVHDIARDIPDGDETTIVSELDSRFHELGLPPGWPTMQIAADATDMARKLGEFQRLHDAPLASELAFDVTTDAVTLRGSMDRLDRAGDGLIVTDYKTGKVALSAAQADVDPQLATYQLALEHGAVEGDAASPAGARLVYLGTDTKTVTQRSQRALADFPNPQWAERMVAQAADIMASGRLWARISDACRTCPIAGACPLQPQGDTLVPTRGHAGTATDAPTSDFSTLEARQDAANDANPAEGTEATGD